MKVTTLIIALLLPILIFSQTKYYDRNDKEITEAQFVNQQLDFMEYRVYNDSLGTAKIVSPPYEYGNLDSDEFLGQLSNHLKLNIDRNKPTMIIYYPGKDPCNSKSSATASARHEWYKDLMKNANKITPTNFLFVYKSKEGLKYTKKDTWYKDPKAMVEHMFFKYHYPCSSYVIIYKDKYYSYFGEFTKDGALYNLQEIIR